MLRSLPIRQHTVKTPLSLLRGTLTLELLILKRSTLFLLQCMCMAIRFRRANPMVPSTRPYRTRCKCALLATIRRGNGSAGLRPKCNFPRRVRNVERPLRLVRKSAKLIGRPLSRIPCCLTPLTLTTLPKTPFSAMVEIRTAPRHPLRLVASLALSRTWSRLMTLPSGACNLRSTAETNAAPLWSVCLSVLRHCPCLATL